MEEPEEAAASAEEPKEPFVLELPYDSIPFATDGFSAPAIWADAIRGTVMANGVTKLSLVDHRMHATTHEIMAVHTATIIMPTMQMASWGAFLLRNAPKPLEPEALEALKLLVAAQEENGAKA